MTSNTNKRELLRILIVDDSELARNGLKYTFKTAISAYRFKVDEAESGEDAIEKVKRRNYDLVFMDYQLKNMNGGEAVKIMLARKPELKILAISVHDGPSYIRHMIEAGAKGYVLKNIEQKELMIAIKMVMENKIYYSKDAYAQLAQNHTPLKRTLKTFTPFGLTKRELEILGMVAMGLTNERIAEKLNIGKRTVETHRERIMNKTHVKNTAGLIKIVYELNLITHF